MYGDKVIVLKVFILWNLDGDMFDLVAMPKVGDGWVKLRLITLVNVSAWQGTKYIVFVDLEIKIMASSKEN